MSGTRKVGRGSRRAVIKPEVSARQEPRPTTLREDATPYRTNGDDVSPSPGAADEVSATDKALLVRGEGGRSGKQLRFIDLFCGIGGFRIAFERAGARCVFSSDWDKFSRQTYKENFKEETNLRSRVVCDCLSLPRPASRRLRIRRQRLAARAAQLKIRDGRKARPHPGQSYHLCSPRLRPQPQEREPFRRRGLASRRSGRTDGQRTLLLPSLQDPPPA